MATLDKSNILNALATVNDPDKGMNVVAADMVQGLVIKQGHVLFSLEVDPARGPVLEPVRKACEDAVYKVPGVLSVTAVLTAHSGEAPQAAKPAPKTAPKTASAQELNIPGVNPRSQSIWQSHWAIKASKSACWMPTFMAPPYLA